METDKDLSSQLCFICKKSVGQLKIVESNTWVSLKKAAERRLFLKTDKYTVVTTDLNLQENKSVENENLFYHPLCYKNYTAVKRTSAEVGDADAGPSTKEPTTRRNSMLPSSDKKGIMKGSCIFCTVKRKTVNGKIEPLSDCLTYDGCQSIFEASEKSNNERIKSLARSEFDLIAAEAQYHKSCRRVFFKEVADNKQQTNVTVNQEFSIRKLHADTFDVISIFLEEDVTTKQRPVFATALFNLYKAEFLGAGGNDDDIVSYTCQCLTKKIKEKFQEKLCVKSYNNRQGNFIYSADMSEMDARVSLEESQESSKMQNMMYTVALHLRAEMLKMAKWKTPQPTTVNNLKEASPSIPDDIEVFFQTMMCGLKKPAGEQSKQRIKRKVMAMSSDAIYNVTRGSVRPWKHTVMALGLGTLTGSKLLLGMMNRLGYTLNYSEVKALETEFAFSIAENDQDTPDGMCLEPFLATGLAWDNYDVNMETLDGKDTLHATVGTCYQNISQNQDVNIQGYRDERNRRNFNGSSKDIPPYYKSLKSASFTEFNSDTVENDHSNNTEDAYKLVVNLSPLDFFWFLQSTLKPIPRFTGFISQYVTDNLPQQKIFYMDPISAGPTRNDVVRETMIRTMNVATETQQEHIVVTYDLAVALKAYAIQAIETPLFDKLLILLGNFHLEMALYGAYGTFIKDSGAEYLLTESGVLASGSVMGFLRGKFYNRCVRVHELLALAMEQKMYEQFLTTRPAEEYEQIKAILGDVPEKNESADTLGHYLKDDFQVHMQEYEKFFKEVLSGKLGPTAQYWAMYILMITGVHRNLMRAIRTNDVSGYISVLPQVISIFFGLNRPNYARWGMLYLKKLENALPECRNVLVKGAFSIRRTSKNFSRSGVDIMLEQTVNRDAASPMHGIVGFQNSENSIRRWCITATQRGLSVTELRHLVGLDKEAQPATQLKMNRVKKDNKDLNAIKTTITEFCDPFTAGELAHDQLINLASGN